MAHECQKEEIIEEIRKRLGNGDVSLATIKVQLDQILAQTTKTNGRVTKLEDLTANMKYTWKMVVKDVTVAVVSVGGICTVLVQVFAK